VPPPIYDWNFRNAVTDTIMDLQSQVNATHTNGLPEDRTPTGIILEDPSYIDLGGNVELGGPMTFEMVVTWLGTGFLTNMPLLACTAAGGIDQILVANMNVPSPTPAASHEVLQWTVLHSPPDYFQMPGGHILKLNVRYHIVTTVQGNGTTGNANATIYFDGVLDKVVIGKHYEPKDVSRPDCYIGKNAGGSWDFLHATVSSLKLYNYSMTEEQIEAAYDEDCAAYPECAAPPATSSGSSGSSGGGVTLVLVGGLLVLVLASVVMSARSRPTATTDSRRVRIHYSDIPGVF
jgi:hypothetical protein